MLHHSADEPTGDVSQGVTNARQRIRDFIERERTGEFNDELPRGAVLLDYCKLTSADLKSVAKELASLTALTTLDLGGNQLTSDASLAEALKPLTALTTLALGSNQLTSNAPLVEAFKPLTELKSLTLNHNQLTSDASLAEALKPLTALTTLDLGGNQLTSDASLAEALKPLTELTTLYLNDNQLTSDASLAEALKPLTELTTLSLNNNQLTSDAPLVEALKPLTELTTLSLNNNQLTSDAPLVEALKPLTELTTLYLHDNKLTSDASLVQALKPLTALHWLSLHGNPLDLQETDLQSKNPQILLNALNAIVTGRARPNPEFKLVILGQGRIGKTQLRHRLMDEPTMRREKETHSFEWQPIPHRFSPPWPADEAERRTDKGVGLGTPAAALHLFDFGGQDALWSSHRFFVSARRTVFIICASYTQSVSSSRLKYWLGYVRHVWEEDCAAEARRRLQEPELDDPGNYDEMLQRVQRSTPLPPIIVVLTQARNPNEPRLPIEEEAECLCAAHGAALVKEYDSFVDAEPQVEEIRHKIAAALYGPDVRSGWTELWSKERLERLATMRRTFGFGERGFDESASRLKLSLDEYYAEICGLSAVTGAGSLISKDDRRQALADLRAMRSLGAVHWVGDHPLVLQSTDEIRSTIFSPASVRAPVYNVLWSKYGDGRLLSRAEVIDELCGAASDSKPTGIGERDAELLLRLMELCGLAFKAEKERTGAIHYLVPDRLPAGGALTIVSDTPSQPDETVLKADLGFVPDLLMPGLIGELWKNFDCPQISRSSCTVVWVVDAQTCLVRMCADQAGGVFRASVPMESFVGAVKTVLNDRVALLLGRWRAPVKFRGIDQGERDDAEDQQQPSLAQVLIEIHHTQTKIGDTHLALAQKIDGQEMLSAEDSDRTRAVWDVLSEAMKSAFTPNLKNAVQSAISRSAKTLKASPVERFWYRFFRCLGIADGQVSAPTKDRPRELLESYPGIAAKLFEELLEEDCHEDVLFPRPQSLAKNADLLRDEGEAKRFASILAAYGRAMRELPDPMGKLPPSDGPRDPRSRRRRPK